MTSHDDLLDDTDTFLPHLHRSNRIMDFRRISSHERASRNSENRSSMASAKSDSDETADSQTLYMPREKPVESRRKKLHSLSVISNGTSRRYDGSSDEKPDDLVESPADAASLHKIDREIFEWQYVCKSGRPYWWSPIAKNTHTQKRQQRSGSGFDGGLGEGDVDDAATMLYKSRRRAVTDSYLADSSKNQDLAHLIAIQLLGACYTLPPEAINAVVPEFTRDSEGKITVRRRQMISSLRMHTSFRYSPSFGHQARNTSPVHTSPARYDGPSRSQRGSNCSMPFIGSSSPCSHPTRPQRTRNNTQGSEEQWEQYEDEDDEDYIRMCCTDDQDPLVGSTAWYTREGVRDTNRRPLMMQRIPSASSKRRRSRTPDCSLDEGTGRQANKSSRSNYRLQPVLRSEPHPVFIQPVRELVVKRWKNFRRRMSGSLNSPLPSQAERSSETLSSYSEDDGRERSEAQSRRLRAQERGDIHSSSMDDSPHYNTPASGVLSPAAGAAGSTFGFGDPLAAAASLVAAGEPHVRAMSHNSTALRRGMPSAASSTMATCGSGDTRSDFLLFTVSSTRKTPASTSSMPSQDSRSRRRRGNSRLSEVCTPEDLQEPDSFDFGDLKYSRSVLSIAGSPLGSPVPEEEKRPWSARIPIRVRGEVTSSPGPSKLSALQEAQTVFVPPRPRMSRMSSSGTQIFTPNEDGIEIDGMPAGPNKEIWADKGGRRERTYL